MLAGFSANSLLCRAALSGGRADAVPFTALRLGSGALALLLLMGEGRVDLAERFHAGRALALAAYAFGFSMAYRVLGAGTGALLLFGAVQATLLSLALLRGESFPPRRRAGALLAFLGLLVLCLPTAQRPGLMAALAMLGAGAAWGVYTWLGKASQRPLVDTGVAFLGAALLALPLVALTSHRRMTTSGALLAAVSGALASGATYALWYAVVPRLGAVRAAVVQLAVPPLTALVAVAWLGEVPGPAWFAAAALTLGGIALAVR
ncbi:MAG TPA: DMT family transporter [Holophagaceae bacterium]|nr:DMT family transporter [Holophagaceae bacterium]